jgi:hypothetical protein
MRSLVILILMLFAGITYSQPHVNRFEQGKVAAWNPYLYDYNLMEGVGAYRGSMQENLFRDDPWIPISSSSYTYDSSGNLVEIATDNLFFNQIDSTKEIMTYDAAGNMLSNLTYELSDSGWVAIFFSTSRYDSLGYRTESKWWSRFSTDTSKVLFEYQQEKLVQRTKLYWMNSQWVNSIRRYYSYNELGQPTGRRTWMGDCGNAWRELSIDTLLYNQQGKPSETREQYSDDGGDNWYISSYRIFVYDEMGRVDSVYFDGYHEYSGLGTIDYEYGLGDNEVRRYVSVIENTTVTDTIMRTHRESWHTDEWYNITDFYSDLWENGSWNRVNQLYWEYADSIHQLVETGPVGGGGGDLGDCAAIFFDEAFLSEYDPIYWSYGNQIWKRTYTYNDHWQVTTSDYFWAERYLLITSIGEQDSHPQAFSLDQNYPNPFNPSTTIQYSLPKQSNMSFTIYDLSGRTILTQSEYGQQAGVYTIEWNGVDRRGFGVPTGVYFARLQAGDYSKTIKMLYLK